jgi:hypothetical protein
MKIQPMDYNMEVLVSPLFIIFRVGRWEWHTISYFLEDELVFALFFSIVDLELNLLFSHWKLLELPSFDNSIDLKYILRIFNSRGIPIVFVTLHLLMNYLYKFLAHIVFHLLLIVPLYILGMFCLAKVAYLFLPAKISN